MDDLIHHLEKRIKSFLEKYLTTKDINHSLQRTHNQLAHEKEQLLLKHKNAVAQIETMVSRLKSIEGLS